MSLIQISLPLRSVLRLVKAVERIASACERAYPPIPSEGLKEPTDGITIVDNKTLLQQEIVERLIRQGYEPSEIEALINGENEITA